MVRGAAGSTPVDVLVIGGGGTGAATAYYASRAGASVTLLERHDLNTEASGRNAGSLHGQIQHEPFAKLGEQWARDWLPALRFLADSLQLWQTLSDELGTDLEVSRRGGLLIADRPEQLRLIERKVALERGAGVDSRMLTAAELRARAPWVSEQAVGGELCAIEGKANPLLTAPAFARSAVTHGARVRCGVEARAISRHGQDYVVDTSEGTYLAHRLVLAVGDATPRFGRLLGTRLPISSGAVQVNVTERVEPFVEHLVYYAGGRLTFKQSRTGTLLIGGGWPARRDSAGAWHVDPDSLRANLSTAIRVAPRIADVRLLRTWVGVGNGTPDHRPILGELPRHPGVLVGLYPYMGFTASPLMGRILAALALDENVERDLSSFAPERFDQATAS